MEIKSNTPKIKQSEIAKFLELSSSVIQRYRREINMVSPYRIPPSSKTNQRKQNTPNTNLDEVKVTSNDLRMTSNDLKTISKNHLKMKKHKLICGAKIEFNENFLDELIQKSYL